MKHFISIMLTMTLLFGLAMPVSAVQENELTEAELWAAVNSGEATVTTEIRDITSFTDEEIEANEGLARVLDDVNVAMPYAVNSNRVSGRAYHTTIDYSGDVVEYFSVPTIELSVYDIGSYASNNGEINFDIYGSVTLNGEEITYWNNAIRYGNICAQVGCGENTAFSGQLSVSGKYSKTEADVLALVGIFSKSTALTTATSIISAFSHIEYGNDYVRSTRIDLSDLARAAGVEFNDIKLHEDGDYLKAEFDLSTVDESLDTNVRANAAVKWTYDVYFGVDPTAPEYSGESLNTTVRYLVNAR